MLIDHYQTMNGEHKFQKYKFDKWMMNERLTATRFLISDETCEQIGKLIGEKPYLFTQNFQFAVPPAEIAYIELNYNILVNAIGANISAPSGADGKTGFMIKKGILTHMSNFADDDYAVQHGKNLNIPIILPSFYVLKGNAIPPDSMLMCQWNELELPKLSREERRENQLAFYLGSTYDHKDARLTEEIKELITSIKYGLENSFAYYLNNRKAMKRHLQDGYGELRIYLSILLWLGQQHVLEIEKIPAKRKLIKGKPVALPSYHVVRLQRKKNIIKQIIHSLTERATPRYHTVRPSMRVINEGCRREDHCWSIHPDPRGHYSCLFCKAKKIPVKEYRRGDPSKGTITKEYIA